LPAQDGPQPRGQLARMNRLGNIVVGAQLQADDTVDAVAPGGEHQHRHGRLKAQPAQHRHTVHLGHHDVEDHGVEAFGEGALEALGRIIGLLAREAITDKVFGKKSREGAIVVDQQYSHGIFPPYIQENHARWRRGGPPPFHIPYEPISPA
jgi:hypothetical protein